MQYLLTPTRVAKMEKNQQHQVLARMWSDQKSHTLGECLLWQSLWKFLLVTTTDAKHMHNLWLSHPLLKRTWEKCTHKFAKRHVQECSSITLINSKLESTQMPIKSTIKKQIMIYSHNKILGSNKNEKIRAHNRNESCKHKVDLKKPNTKRFMKCSSIYIY